MNIYVGNLPYETTETDLQEAFSAFGSVASVNIIRDKFSGQSKGFGFIEMSNDDEGQAAVNGMNGKELKGRQINVSQARPRAAGSRDRGPGGPRREGGGRMGMGEGNRRGGGGGGGRR